ncbi:MAG: signal peptide peptidase SppA [Alphaproteobacteria bacterium]
MTLDADTLIDRKRLKRRLGLWRVLAILALIAVVVVAVGRFDFFWQKRHVARLTVSGIITDNRLRDEALARVAKDSNVAALILYIDSPGGTVVGGETLYRSVRATAEKKPVVAVMGTLATSGGYMAALAADYIFAREGTITGSIGIVLQTTDITGLLSKLGISAEAIKSGPLKAVPSPFEPLSDEAREATMAVVTDMYEMFVDMVVEQRKLPRETVLKLADGRIYTGRQAAANGLIDETGGEEAARQWLEKEHDISKSLPVRDVRIKRGAADWLKLVGSLTGKTLFSERLTLDGLVSLWHPEGR